jgi:hypothetical protein
MSSYVTSLVPSSAFASGASHLGFDYSPLKVRILLSHSPLVLFLYVILFFVFVISPHL